MEEETKMGSKHLLWVIVFVVVLSLGGYYIARSVRENATKQSEEATLSNMMEEQNNTSGGMMQQDDTMMQNDDANAAGGTVPSGGSGMMNGAADEGVMMMADTKEYNINGIMFEFSMPEIRVKKGETVVVNFKSIDGLHDWVLEGYGKDIRTPQLKIGESASVSFVADKTGTYTYYCSVGQHRARGMVGTLIVE